MELSRKAASAITTYAQNNHADVISLRVSANERESNWEKEAEASSVEKTGYSEVMRTSGAQDRNAGIQSMCMEYQQTCI